MIKTLSSQCKGAQGVFPGQDPLRTHMLCHVAKKKRKEINCLAAWFSIGKVC